MKNKTAKKKQRNHRCPICGGKISEDVAYFFGFIDSKSVRNTLRRFEKERGRPYDPNLDVPF